jgi:hypothetical protein
MAGADRLLHRLRALGRSEEGMALPFALFATIATMALAGAAVISSIDVQQGSHRDSQAKSAIAAADAGAGVAMMRLNRYADSLTNASNQNCIGVSAEGKLVITGATNGWCPAISGTVGSSTYSYRVSAMVAGATMTIVSTGTAGGVSRRVAVALGAESVEKILKEEGLIGESSIHIEGGPHLRVNLGTNGSIETTEGEGENWEICGNARHGVGAEGPSEEELSCEGEEEEEEIILPPVSNFLPPEIREDNADGRLEQCITKDPQDPAECEDDNYSGKRTSTHPFDPEGLSISLEANDTLSLGSSEKDYWLCQLTMSGSSELIMAAGANVSIFFATPEECGMSSSEPQIKVTGNSNIKATGFNPELGAFDMPAIYMLGGPASVVELAGTGGSNQFLLYAPDTEIRVLGTAEYNGVIAGGTLKLSGHPTFQQQSGFEPRGIPGNTLYSRQSYVECSGAAVGTPDENC